MDTEDKTETQQNLAESPSETQKSKKGKNKKKNK